MDDIVEPTIDYDFSKLYLGPPTTLSGGAYFTRVMYNNNKQLYIQTPKSLTKQGFVKNGKKIFTDLMFDNNDTVFINWIENLESKCQDLIYTKGQNWFENKLEKDDIESAFTSPFKIFKSGKFYLLRVNVKQNIKIYDEKDQIINVDDITCDKTLISILEIQGIKFTSRNFQIEIELKQAMVVSPDPFLDECFIKKPIKNTNHVTIVEEQINKEEVDSNSNSNSNLEEFLSNDSAKDLNVNFISEDCKNEKIETNSLEEKERKEEIEEIEEIEEKETINLEESFENLEDKESFSEAILKEDENIVLDVQELTSDLEEDPNSLKEIDLSSTLENNLETITLKKPNQVYYEIYQKAREKAKEQKKQAVLAYLEMKNIKKTYMLDDIDESDSEFEEFDNENDYDNESVSENDEESLENNLE
jgi:hypothetical protein